MRREGRAAISDVVNVPTAPAVRARIAAELSEANCKVVSASNVAVPKADTCCDVRPAMPRVLIDAICTVSSDASASLESAAIWIDEKVPIWLVVRLSS